MKSTRAMIWSGEQDWSKGAVREVTEGKSSARQMRAREGESGENAPCVAVSLKRGLREKAGGGFHRRHPLPTFCCAPEGGLSQCSWRLSCFEFLEGDRQRSSGIPTTFPRLRRTLDLGALNNKIRPHTLSRFSPCQWHPPPLVDDQSRFCNPRLRNVQSRTNSERSRPTISVMKSFSLSWRSNSPLSGTLEKRYNKLGLDLSWAWAKQPLVFL